MPNVLLVATGSVAAVRTGLLAEELHAKGHTVRLIHTSASSVFLNAERPLPSWLPVFSDEGEWRLWNKLGDQVQHIELRNWASALVFAPLDANTLAKLANGLCDNLATCVARAWPMRVRPMVVAPAMNSAMWMHPVTAGHLKTLHSWGVTIIDPVVKKLACGDTGVGAMAPRDVILREIESLLAEWTDNITSCAVNPKAGDTCFS